MFLQFRWFIAIFCQKPAKIQLSAQESKQMKLEQIDHFDTTILSALATHARASQVHLAEHVGLSSTAIARRQKPLQSECVIRGYQAVLDFRRLCLSTTFAVWSCR